MRKLNRRTFLGTTAAGLIAAGAPLAAAGKEAASAPRRPGAPRFDRPVSFQSYGMRREIGEDFIGTLNAVRALGYDGVELCSPHGPHYKQVGFGKLTDVPPAELKRQIEDTGLVCRSAHFGPDEVLTDKQAKTIEYAAALGLQDIIMSVSGINKGTVDDFKRWGEQCNRAGEAVRAAGLRLGYHNHAVGPVLEDGKPEYEHIMDVLDPDLVTMQFQFASISDGYDIEYYLDKYAGRYSSLHMHDWDPARKGRRPGRLGGIVPLGEGMIDWAAVLKAAMKSDIADHGFIVEIETEEPLEGLRRSISYLKTVEI